jgi:hypothetical protein
MNKQIFKHKYRILFLVIWWGIGLLLAHFSLTIFPVDRPFDEYGRLYALLIVLVGTYFIVTQIVVLRQALLEGDNTETHSLLEKWQKVMPSALSIQLSLVAPLLTLPINRLFHPIVNAILAPNNQGWFSASPPNPILYITLGSLIVYLHLYLLAGWLILLGLIQKIRFILVIGTMLIGSAIGMSYLTYIIIEKPMLEVSYNDYFCQAEGIEVAEEYSIDCNLYWMYRNINRVVQTIEYGLYGIFSGGLQYLGLITSRINGEFLRNLIAGILSPLLQLFFIMRYLKRRSFEKAKREYA